MNKMIMLGLNKKILDVGDSYSGLREEIENWLITYCKSYKFGFSGGYYLNFSNDDDLALFKLTWL